MAKISAPPKLLVIRFSSFGDIVQALSIPAAFKAHFPNAEVHWAIREDFRSLTENHHWIDHTWPLARKDGLKGLWQLSQVLAAENFSHVYDAHNNIRSRLLIWFLTARQLLSSPTRRLTWIRRSKNRLKRWLLFRFRWNLLPNPFRGVESFLQPLAAWGIHGPSPVTPQFFLPEPLRQTLRQRISAERYIALVPSAAWEMKRWPLHHWKKLIAERAMDQFVVLGGPDDAFCEDIRAVAPDRVVNLAGQLSLEASAAVVANAEMVISGDTGLLHIADQLGVPAIALIGPTAFGYPSHPGSRVLELELNCKPCSKDGRGVCKNKIYQKCLVELTPARVAAEIERVREISS